MNDIQYIHQRILDITNPDVDYTQEDFDKEFSETGLSKNSIKIDLKFKNESNNPDPEYATDGASGFDLRASLAHSIEIPVGEFRIIPTGLFFEIPDNMEIQIRSRSGLAAKNGVAVLNSPGTIDSDYRGEVKVILINHGKQPFVVFNGDRIAQGVISGVITKNFINLNRINEINLDTKRGSGGFGSTGLS
jgi:dUTP pyrophosphatase